MKSVHSHHELTQKFANTGITNASERRLITSVQNILHK